MKAMLGFHLKRQLLTLINDETQVESSPLYGIKVLYSGAQARGIEREAIYGVGGISQVEAGDASGTLDVDNPRASIAVRIAQAGADLAEWTTDERAEEVVEAIGQLIAANRHLAGSNTVASVYSYQWENPSTMDDNVTLVLLEVGIEGYV